MLFLNTHALRLSGPLEIFRRDGWTVIMHDVADLSIILVLVRG